MSAPHTPTAEPLELPGFLSRWWPYALVYSLVGAIGLYFFQYQMNPDVVSYIDVAHAWLRGDFELAINAYWSPLLPVLSAPLMAMGWPNILALKLISLGGGLLVLWVLYRLCQLNDFSALLQGAVLLIGALLCVSTAMLQTTPDVLACGALLALVYLLFRPVQTNWQRTAMLIALALAMGYFSKLFVLYFALIALPLVWLMRRKQLPGTTRRLWLKQTLLGYAGGLLLCLLWVVPLSIQVGHFTFGEAGAFNYELVMARERQFPMATEGLLPPPEGATSAWVDITRVDYHAEWPQSPGAFMAQQAEVLATNFIIVAKLAGRELYVLMLVPIFYLVWVYRKEALTLPAFQMLVLMAVYVGGYLLVIVELRYLLPAVLVALLLAAKGVQAYNMRELGHLPIVRLAPVALLMWALGEVPAAQLWEQRFSGAEYVSTANTLEAQYPAHKRIATTRFDDDAWHKGLYVSYWRGASYFGSLNTTDRLPDRLLLLNYHSPLPCPPTHTCQTLDSLQILAPKPTDR